MFRFPDHRHGGAQAVLADEIRQIGTPQRRSA
jgi:hypothetical protein